MATRRNKKAGKHPSYDKRGMSESARKRKQAYDKKFSSSPEQKKKRADCNKKRKQAKKAGKNISGKDYDHATRRFVSTSTNRGRKGEGRSQKEEINVS